MTSWRVRLADPHGERAVLVDGEPDAPRGELVTALAAAGWCGTEIVVDGEVWTHDDPRPLAGGLRQGALLRAALSDDGPGSLDAGWYVVVLGGPASGRFHPLAPGAPVSIGRDRVRLAIDDPLLSGEHCEFRLDAAGVASVRDLGSRNGTLCDGALVGETPVPLGPEAIVHAGATLLGVRRLGDGERVTLLGATATARLVQRQFREALPELPDPPAAPRSANARDDDGSGGVWMRALVPLVTAAGMAMLTGRWWFLALGALSPLVYGYDTLRRVRRRRREHATDAARHAEAHAAYTRALAELRTAETRRARRQHGGAGAAALLGRFGHRSVWERRPTDCDFCSVTIGHAVSASRYPTDKTAAELWSVPLTIGLHREGPLGITGPAARTRAVARALLVDLAYGHAPGDLRVWVFTDSGDEWAWAQWLPHLFTAGAGARLATDSAARATLARALHDLLDARRHPERAGARPLPLHVVLVDGVHTLAAAALAELLGEGPALGVIGIVADPGIVPEGVLSEIRLGPHADECVYRSVVTPPVAAVAAAELTTDVALGAALALAPLDSVGGSGESHPVGRVHLTELLDLSRRTPADQAERWRAGSPCTRVRVGVTTDGMPFELDLVADGPHALVAGMTRSGKTEFLKTWLAALALSNHPDDLAVVIVDFKGGVDHRALADLPHVVALATNQDVDLFERTLALLGAEQQRRQRLFADDAGVATLEAYRTARADRPELPILPRLILVVDEFAELLATPEGRAQLGRLESTARIGAGLGVHLVLVTQMFDHALPATIDGQAGLRVCFRVQRGEHSNVVVKSPAAAAIDTSMKGRAVARIQGGELIEFQAARVGNAAGATDGAPLSVRPVDVAALARPGAAPAAPETAHTQQDLHRVIQLVRQAMEHAGTEGVEAVLPWPGELPERVMPGDLADAAAGAAGVPIGLADDPAHQRVVPLVLGDDELVLYAGSPGSGHHDALVATACQVARHTDPGEVHIYGIDAVGHGLAPLAGLPHTGAVASRDDATALRILSHLTGEANARRDLVGAPPRARIVLFVLGLDRLSLHAEGCFSPLLAPLTALANELPGTGIQLVCSGAHATLSTRIGMTVGRRLVFAANDPLEYPPTVPRAMRARLAGPGRCFDQATGLLAQVVTAELPARVPEPSPARRPRRFDRAPWPLRSDRLDATFGAPPTAAPGGCPPLPLGVAPDTGEPVWLEPDEDGSAFRIIGPPKSGRSNALAAIGVLSARCGWNVVVSAASRRSPLATLPLPRACTVPVDQLAEWVAERIVGPTVVLVDDAHRLADDYPWRRLTAASAPVVMFVAGSADGLSRPLGVTRAVPASGGVSLMPTRTRDADTFGVRALPDEWLVVALAGVGVAAVGGEARRIQFPLVLDAPARSLQQT